MMKSQDEIKKGYHFVLDGIEIFSENPRKILSLILSRNDLSFWSSYALAKFYQETCEILIEYCLKKRNELSSAEKASNTRYIKKIKSSLENYPVKILRRKNNKDPKTRLLSRVYNTILQGEGHVLKKRKPVEH